jgi:signal transduction histidine kinase
MRVLKKEGKISLLPRADSGWLKRYILPEDQPGAAVKIAQAIAEKRLLCGEHRLIAANGQIIWVYSRTAPLFNRHGEITVWLGVASDITERKEFEQKLVEAEEECLKTLDSSSLGSLKVDYTKKECQISETWKRRLGLESCPGKVLFAEPFRVIHPEDFGRIELLWKDTLRAGEAKCQGEYRVLTVDLGYVWVYNQSRIVYDKDGNPQKAYGVFIDINDKKMAEKALSNSEKNARVLIQKLHQAAAKKDNFISTLSHELRNPLATISMALTLLEQVAPGSEQDERTRGIIGRQTAQLMRLVDDLLDISRLGKDKIKLYRERVDLNAVGKRVLEEFKVNYEQKGVVLEGSFGEPLYIEADLGRIRQVLSNLLDNALKFTPKGGQVQVTVAEDREAGQAVITFLDSGIGIPPELIPDLFEPFTQAENSLSAGGLGLGLSIVKGIVELHGGTVGAKSEGLGQGAEFQVRLPLA